MASQIDPYRPASAGRRRRPRARALLAAALLSSALCVTIDAVAGVSPASATDIWSAPVDLSPATGTASVPQVASNSSGDAVAAWLRVDGATYSIEASRYTHGTASVPGTWSAYTQLVSSAQITAEPAVEIDDAGVATVIWRRSDGANSRIETQRSIGTTNTFTATATLSAAGGDARGPELSVDPAGNVTAAWYRYNPAPVFATLIESARFSVGTGTWGATQALSSNTGDSFLSRVASDAAGNVIAIWRKSNGTNNIVQAARYSPGSPGTWTLPTDISPSDDDAANIQVTVDPAGNATAVWVLGASPNSVVQTARYAVNTPNFAWTSPLTLSAAGGKAVAPRVGSDSDGIVTAIWRRDDATGKSIIQATRYLPSTGQWTTVVDLSAAGQNALAPRLAVDKSGNVTAVWTRKNDGSFFTVQSARFALEVDAWAAASNLSASGADGQTPQTDVDDDGNVVVVWARANTTGGTVVQAAISSPAPGFTPVSPVRVFDTRPGESANALRQVAKVKIGGATELRVKFSDLTSGSTVITPATGVVAVSVNVAVTNPTGNGFVTVYPCANRQEVASVNYVTGQTVSNAVIAPLSPTGELCFYSYAPADIVVDLNGWFPTTANFNSVTPSRVFDTRPGESPNAIRSVTKAKVGPGNPLQVQVSGLGTLTPATGVSAVALNVAITNPDNDGFVTVFPCGPRPFVASVNYVKGQTVSNAVIAPVSADGNICFYSLKQTDIVVDINGWFSTATGFTAAPPARVFDTRGESPDALVTVPVARVSSPELKVKVTNLAAGSTTITPPIGVAAVSINVTAVNPQGDGYITVYPCGTRGLVASVNYSAGQIVPNAVIAPVSADGYICFFSYAPTDIVVDINGWFPTNG